MGLKANAILILASALPAFAISPVPLLDREVRSFESNLGTDNLWPLCQRIDQPCGLEELETNDPSLNGKPVEAPPADQNVRDALDSIVARAPKYQWKMHEEYAINIEPKEIPKDDPLERKIKRISLKGMSSTRAALNILHAANALGTFQPPGNFRLRRIKDLELKNVSVREALNRIVIADGHAMWVVSPVKNRGTLSLFFGLWEDKYQIAEHDLKGPEYHEEMQRIHESWSKWNVR